MWRAQGGQNVHPLGPTSPDEKAMIQDALERLAVAEIRNAMIATHQPGYENRKPMSRERYVAELDALRPGLAAELEFRLRKGQPRANSYDAVMRAWPEAEARLRKEGANADLTDLAGQASAETAAEAD